MQDVVAIKNRVNNIQSIVEIADAMQIITTIMIGKINKLLKYRKLVQPYYDRLFFSMERKVQRDHNHKKYLILFFSEKGFCGQFNHQLLPSIKKMKEENREIILFGSKGVGLLKNIGIKADYFFEAARSMPIKEDVDAAVKLIVQDGLATDVKVVFNKFVNVFQQIPTILDYFPPQDQIYNSVDVLSDLSREVIDEAILEKYIRNRMYYFFIHNFVGEISTKFMLMKNAVENGNNAKDNLLKEMYKVRQMKITQELTEIVTAYKVLQEERKRV